MFVKIKIFLVPAALVFSQPLIYAQIDSAGISAEQAVENILQEPNEEADNSQLYEIFEDLINNPININEANLADMQKIPYLSLSAGKIIVQHRKKYGHFFSTNELYSIKNLPAGLIDKIIPFITVSSKVSTRQKESSPRYAVDARSRLMEDLQQKKGFAAGKFVGSKYKVYNRISVEYNNKYKIGFLTDKDAGEKGLNEFTSFYVSMEDLGIIKQIVGGDYLLVFGQGLTLWSPYGFSKGANAIYTVKKRGRKISEYKSSTENNFFRGGAVTLSAHDFSLTAFYSKNKMDANIDSASGEILSTPINGLHRTETEILKRKSAQEEMIGASLGYSIDNFLNAGLLFYRSSFSNSFLPNSVYDISGNEFDYYSFFYNSFIGNFNFFGEFSYNGTSTASVNGVEVSINENFTFITLLRNYPANFNSLHGFGFGERSGSVKNEFGIYNGLRWRTPIGLINFYFDQFKFPYATFDNPIPSGGNEFLIDLTSKPLKHLKTRLRYKTEKKEITEALSGSKILVNRLRQSFRVEIIYELSKNLRLKGRVQYNKFFLKELDLKEEGYLMFQDIRFYLPQKLSVYFRAAFFKTDSFNSAIYVYENDIAGVLTNRAAYGEGIKWYFLIKYQLLDILTISCKYSETYKPNVETLGSGNSEIEGNLSNRLGIQLDFNL